MHREKAAISCFFLFYKESKKGGKTSPPLGSTSKWKGRLDMRDRYEGRQTLVVAFKAIGHSS